MDNFTVTSGVPVAVYSKQSATVSGGTTSTESDQAKVTQYVARNGVWIEITGNDTFRSRQSESLFRHSSESRDPRTGAGTFTSDWDDSQQGWSLQQVNRTSTPIGGTATHRSVTSRFNDRRVNEDGSNGGGFTSNGARTGGRFYSHSSGGGSRSVSDWSSVTVPGVPTVTADYRDEDRPTHDVTVDLTFNSAGAASGTRTGFVKSDGQESYRLDEQGSYTNATGSGSVNDYSSWGNTYKPSVTFNLSWAAGTPSGTVTKVDSTSAGGHGAFNRSFNRHDGLLNTRNFGNQNWSYARSDTLVEKPVGSGSGSGGFAPASRTLTLSQSGMKVAAFSDSGPVRWHDGSTVGSWDQSSRRYDRWNDTSTLRAEHRDGAWRATSRTFTIDRAGDSSGSYHQRDSLSRSASAHMNQGAHSYKLDIDGWSKYRQKAGGTDASYSFSTERSGRWVRDEAFSGSWANPQYGDSGSQDAESHVVRAFRNGYQGAVAGGAASYASIDEYRNDHTRGHRNTYSRSPNVANEFHRRWFSNDVRTRTGTGQQGAGSRVSFGKSAEWWLSKDAATGQTLASGGNPDPEPVASQTDLSWGQVSQQPEATWASVAWADVGSWAADLYAGATQLPGQVFGAALSLLDAGSDVLRVVGGVVDVAAGAYVTVQTGGVGGLLGGGLLILNGVDQFITGAYNIAAGFRAPSAVEYAGAAVARAAGVSPANAELIGALTPLAVSGTAFGAASLARRHPVFTAGGFSGEVGSSAGGNGLLFTGARRLSDPTAMTQREAEAVYDWIRGLDGGKNIATVARNTGIPEQVVRSVRQHVFFEKHLLPDEAGKMVLRRFDADDGIATWWKAATEGGIPKTELERVSSLFAHEYVERCLMQSGMPYRRFVEGTPPGAHDLSPLVPNLTPGSPLYRSGVGPWDHTGMI